MTQSRCLLSMALVLAPLVGRAATLRPMTTLDAPVVRLSDLFDDAGPLAARVLGPAPPPGERIVVPARQLAAIARMFGVAWHPIAPTDSAVLERPGRLLARAAVLDVLRPALVGLGLGADADIRLSGFIAPMIPLHAAPQLSVEQLDYVAATGRFAASLLLTGEGMSALHLRLSGHAEEMAQVAVPARALPAGSVPRADDLTFARLPVRSLRAAVARDAAQIVGMTLRHPAAAGAPVPLADLAAPGSVTRGGRVLLRVMVGGLTATTQGIALAAAAPGERVQVLNPFSHMIVEGELGRDGVVGVAPESMPIPAGTQAFMQAAVP